MSTLDVRAVDEKSLKSRPFPKVRQEFRVHISEEAFDAAVARGDADTTREVGGVLVGEVLHDDAGPYVLVESTIDALHADEKGAELTFTHSTWEHIHKQMDTKYAGKKVVGWYHTHPGFGIFLSDRDQFIHKSFFNLPFQIALVYDPKSRAHGVFSWHANETWRARRYFIGGNEHLWDGARSTETAASLPPAPVKEAPAPAPPEKLDLITVGMGALVLFVIAGGLGWWLGGRDASALVSHLQVELVKSQQDGARLAVAQLDAELMTTLRAALGDESRGPLDEIQARLAEAGAALAAGGPDARAQALAKIEAARAAMARLRDGRATARLILARVENAARMGPTQSLREELALQRAALVQLYLELAGDAAKAGDGKRAQRYTQLASTIAAGARITLEPPP